MKEEWKEEMKELRRQEISQLKIEMQASLQKATQDLTTSVNQQIDEKIEQQTEKALQDNEDFLKVKREVAYWKMKAETMSEVCDHMNIEMNDLLTRVENLEINNSKKMVLISGIQIEGEKDEIIHELSHFFEQTIHITVGIDDYFFIGGDATQPRSVVVILKTMEDKGKVMEMKNNLKGIKQQGSNRKIYINDYLPPAVNEKRRRDREVIAMSYPEDPQQEHEVKYTTEGLTIQGQVYRKLVQVPTPKQLININPENMERLLNIKTKRSKDIERSRSIFTAYTAPVNSIEQIQDLYKKMKLIQPSARHIVCAYIIDHSKSYFAKDYQDDQEPGAGRVILRLISKIEWCLLQGNTVVLRWAWRGSNVMRKQPWEPYKLTLE